MSSMSTAEKQEQEPVVPDPPAVTKPNAGFASVRAAGFSKTTYIIIAASVASAVVVVTAIVVAVVVTSGGNGGSGGSSGNNSDDDSPVACGELSRLCSSNDVLILDEWYCDGLPDCSQGEDEDDCGRDCGDEFECADHERCVEEARVCDRTDDCDDGSDEWNCLVIVTVGSDDVLLINSARRVVPVCSTNYDSAWNDDICSEMGFGTGVSSGTIASSSVDQSADGFILPTSGGSISSSSLEVLDTFSTTCAAGTVVTLTCTYDGCGTRGRSVDVTTGNPRVVAGYEAEDGAWPWQVALLQFGSFSCGGTLIANDWVVTRASCVTFSSSFYSVRVGSNRISGGDTNLQTSSVTTVYKHESYDEMTNQNDIALLKLTLPVTFDDYVRPVCLPDSTSDEFFDSVACYTSGWGEPDQADADVSPRLQEVKLPLITDSECSADGQVSAVGGITDDQMICAGYGDLSGCDRTCTGNSGGPLVCRDKRNVWTLVGINSRDVPERSTGCSSLAIFTEVAHYADWIMTTQTDNA